MTPQKFIQESWDDPRQNQDVAMAARSSMGKMGWISSGFDQRSCAGAALETGMGRGVGISGDQQVAYGLVCCYTRAASFDGGLSFRFFIHQGDFVDSV